MSDSNGILALEMEEVESLVGTGNRQKLGSVKRLNGSINGAGKNDNPRTWLASCATQRNFLPKCVVLACVALLVLLVLSAKDEQSGGGVSVGGDVEEKSPVPMPTMAPTVAAVPTEPPVDETARKKAEEEAAAAAKKKAEEEADSKKKAEEEAAAKKKAEEEAAALKKAEEEAAAKKKAEEEAAAKKKAEEEAEAKKKVEEEAEAKKKAEEEAAATKKIEEAAAAKKKADEEAGTAKKDEPAAPPPPSPTPPTTDPPKDSFYYSNRATIPPLIDHPFADDKMKEALSEKFGSWHFWDGDEESRPLEDYCGKYPNRDIPGEDFPDEAWQADAVFVNHILNDADQLIGRAMEAIFTEYGHGKPLEPEQLAERMKMFHWSREDLSTATEPPDKYNKKGDRGNGGWTTKRSFSGLVRRMLHAMMTQDTFTVVMGGHSAAAGQGWVI